jgi:ATP-dependent Clp protease ATP-binding subunit ClpC
MCEGFDLAVNSHLASSETSSRHASRGVVSAVFERFTERAIKSVMLAQREAKSLGKREVGTEQLLLGLIAEERGKEGYLGSGVTLERAREAVRSLLDESVGSGMLGPATDVPFSHGSKRVFEAALEHSKKMGHNYIAPEHIAIALLAVDDGGASRVLDRCVFCCPLIAWLLALHF